MCLRLLVKKFYTKIQLFIFVFTIKTFECSFISSEVTTKRPARWVAGSFRLLETRQFTHGRSLVLFLDSYLRLKTESGCV